MYKRKVRGLSHEFSRYFFKHVLLVNKYMDICMIIYTILSQFKIDLIVR